MTRLARGHSRWVAAALLVAAVAVATTGTAGAQAGIEVRGLDGQPLEGPLLQLNGLLPGDSVTAAFEVVNQGSEPATLRLAGDGGDSEPVRSDVASGMVVTVATGHRGVYDDAWHGTLAQLPEATIALGSVGAGQSIAVRLTGRLSPTLTNAAAGTEVRTGIDLTLSEGGSDQTVVLGVTGERGAPGATQPPQTHRDSLPLTGMDAERLVAALVVLLLTGAVLRRIGRHSNG